MQQSPLDDHQSSVDAKAINANNVFEVQNNFASALQQMKNPLNLDDYQYLNLQKTISNESENNIVSTGHDITNHNSHQYSSNNAQSSEDYAQIIGSTLHPDC